MSDPIQFPGTPRSQDSYLNEQGENPFADQSPTPGQTSQNVFASASSGKPASGTPHFESTFSNRSTIIFRLAAISLTFIVSIILLNFLQSIISVLAPFNLALSVPAWIMGYGELRSVRYGATEARGKSWTRAGTRMAMVSTLTTLTFIAARIIQWFA